jgi:hypothetical protein
MARDFDVVEAPVDAPRVEWRTFAEGERVRLRLSPECRYDGHEPEIDGRTGVVVQLMDWDVFATEAPDSPPTDHDRVHTYAVDLDEPFLPTWAPARLAAVSNAAERRLLLHTWRTTEGFFAANELEPVDA